MSSEIAGISESELLFKLFVLLEFQRLCSARFQHFRNLSFSLLALLMFKKCFLQT